MGEDRMDNCWWRDPWWEDDNWVSQSPYTLAQIRAAVEELKTVFSCQWALRIGENDFANIFLRNVRCGQSIWQHRYIIELGQRIARLRDRPGCSRVLSRLQSVDESESADMELSLADLLLTSSFEIEFPIAKSRRGKSPDIIASCGTETVAFECKQLKKSRKQQWLDLYYRHASQLLRDRLDTDERRVQFIFEEPPVDRYVRDGKPLREATLVAAETIESLVSYVQRQYRASSCPLTFEIKEIGSGRFVGKSDRDAVWVQYPSMAEDRLFERLFANGIAPASEQLRTVDYPGIAAVYDGHNPSLQYAQHEFATKVRNDPSRYEHLTACLVFQRQPLFQYRPPLLLINPVSRIPLNRLKVSKIIRDAYKIRDN